MYDAFFEGDLVGFQMSARNISKFGPDVIELGKLDKAKKSIQLDNPFRRYVL
jgi:hypothetical protein